MEKEKETNQKDHTKEKIILFVIGVLVGAVISTGAFFAYINIAGIGNSSSQSSQMPSGTPPEKPSGDSGGNTPPDMPSNDSESSDQSGTSSNKPSKKSSSTSSNNSQDS